MPSTHAGVGGVDRVMMSIPVGMSGVNRQTKTAYAGVSGVNRVVFTRAVSGTLRFKTNNIYSGTYADNCYFRTMPGRYSLNVKKRDYLSDYRHKCTAQFIFGEALTLRTVRPAGTDATSVQKAVENDPSIYLKFRSSSGKINLFGDLNFSGVAVYRISKSTTETVAARCSRAASVPDTYTASTVEHIVDNSNWQTSSGGNKDLPSEIYAFETVRLYPSEYPNGIELDLSKLQDLISRGTTNWVIQAVEWKIL